MFTPGTGAIPHLGATVRDYVAQGDDEAKAELSDFVVNSLRDLDLPRWHPAYAGEVALMRASGITADSDGLEKYIKLRRAGTGQPRAQRSGRYILFALAWSRGDI